MPVWARLSNLFEYSNVEIRNPTYGVDNEVT